MSAEEKVIYVYDDFSCVEPSLLGMKKCVEEIRSIVRTNWEQIAKEYGLSRGQIEDMSPAFSECLFK